MDAGAIRQEYLDETAKAVMTDTYVLHLLAGGQRVMPPFKSQISLRVQGNQWRAASVSNVLAKSRWPFVRLAVHPDDDPKGREE